MKVCVTVACLHDAPQLMPKQRLNNTCSNNGPLLY